MTTYEQSRRFINPNTKRVVFGEIEDGLDRAGDAESFLGSPQAEVLKARLLSELSEVDVLSLDVFDTLLIRDGKSELERFFDIAQRFVALAGDAQVDFDVTPRTALIARIYSASTAYRLGKSAEGCIEGRLKDIALNAVKSLRLDKSFSETWLRAELAVEAEQLRVSPLIDELIEAAMAGGTKVVLLSDMYLDQDNIAHLLKSLGFAPERCDAIISSADRVLNKRSGTIFPALADEFELAGDRFFHIGDSLRSDYQMPKTHGWRAQHLPVPRAILQARAESHQRMLSDLFADASYRLPMAAPAVT